MRSINLDQLRTLVEIAEQGSFSAAARKLNLTQPAVSAQIRELEARFGVPLLVREGRRSLATEAGRELIEHAHRLFEIANRTTDAMRRRRQGRLGRIHVATNVTTLIYVLLPAMKQLRSDYPDIDLVVTTGTTHGVTERMLQGIVDLGFVALPVDEREFQVVPVLDDPMIAIFPAAERKLPREVTPGDMEGRNLVLEYERGHYSRLAREWLEAGGGKFEPAMEFDRIDAIKLAVSLGLGASIIPSIAIAGGEVDAKLAVRPLNPAVARTLAMIQLRRKPAHPALEIVRNAILSLAKTAPRSTSARPRARQRG